MDRQSERLQQMGIHPAFTVNAVHVRVTDQKSYEDRRKPDILYAEWTVREADDQVIVTSTEYGYLRNGEG
jgi:hypothetical protein